MGQRMTWEEMKKAYPDEWVALVNYSANPSGTVDGEIVLHSNDKTDFYLHVEQILPQYEGMAIRYTGEMIKDAEVPLLWQTLHTA